MTLYFLRLKHFIDNLSLRERIIVTIMIVLALVVLWSDVILSWQQQSLSNMQRAAEQEQAQFNIINAEVSRIQSAIKSPSTFTHRKRYQELMQKIADIEYGLQNHKQRVISQKEVHRVIYGVLKDIKKIKLLSFKSVDENDEGKQKNSKTLSDTVASTLPGFNVSMEKYELVVSGQYFSILDYLKRLERQGWQFYWETLEYKVEKYPMATVTIHFHTLVKNDV